MRKVLLISMPCAALDRPALGLSLLQARLGALGIACDIHYFTFAFAELIGHEAYLWLTTNLPYTAFVGDWIFAQVLYGEQPNADQGYIQEVLRTTWQLDDLAIQHILRIRSLVPHFLIYCLAAVPWAEYSVVGFTSTFVQNLASLALAKRLKELYPYLQIVFGGANWEGEMGEELHRQFHFVDFVCLGEADESFPALIHRLTAGGSIEQSDPIRGLVYRADGQSISMGPATLIRAMDEIPTPDFHDYFDQFTRSTATAAVVPVLLMETARGCWWGDKSHCTFCGLNGGAMTFRSKSASRVLDELAALVDQWQIDFVEVVDNILDMRHFSHLMPTLATWARRVQLFYEVKANLSHQQVRLLRAAGVSRIQPGIESMSDHVLKLMRKGTTALRNIQLLKWCREQHIAVDWNILYGFPGELQEDYAAMLALFPAIRFLGAPTACGPIRLDRFSPYHDAPTAFGLTNVRPLAMYKYLYPFDDASLARIAYYFDYDYAPEVDPTGYSAAVIAYVKDWQHQPERGTLASLARPDGTLRLVDSRTNATQYEYVLAGPDRAAYDYCDEVRSGASIVRYLQCSFSDTFIAEDRVYAFLDSLVANRLMVTDGKHYLSLAIAVEAVYPNEQHGAALLTSAIYDKVEPGWL